MTKPLLLIVDDEPDIARFVGDVAESIGFEVLIAGNAIEFQQHYINQELTGIVMDIVLPEIDGIELINWLAENNSHASIIFMSGYDTLYIDTAKNLGVRKGLQVLGTLSKPFTVEELEPLLKRIINF